MTESVQAVFSKVRRIFLLSTVIALSGATMFAQSSTTTGMTAGSVAGTIASAIALRKMKAAKPSVSVSPIRLDFNGVSVGKAAPNILAVMNGTSSQIEVEALSLPPSGFRFASSITLPFTIPPQTEALLTLEFVPTRPGTQTGKIEVRYRTSGSESVQKMEATLKGKGVQP